MILDTSKTIIQIGYAIRTVGVTCLILPALIIAGIADAFNRLTGLDRKSNLTKSILYAATPPAFRSQDPGSQFDPSKSTARLLLLGAPSTAFVLFIVLSILAGLVPIVALGVGLGIVAAACLLIVTGSSVEIQGEKTAVQIAQSEVVAKTPASLSSLGNTAEKQQTPSLQEHYKNDLFLPLNTYNQAAFLRQSHSNQ
ncbi:MAG: hypothetical protein NTW08_04030 [Gammaproteobacteria bacterium]|nr:hypothetical protein [Gammaproteobacteria bacterium]